LESLAAQEMASLAQDIVVGEALLHHGVQLALGQLVPHFLVRIAEAEESHGLLPVCVFSRICKKSNGNRRNRQGNEKKGPCTRRSSGPKSGTGSVCSVSVSGPPNRSMATAFIVLFVACFIVDPCSEGRSFNMEAT